MTKEEIIKYVTSSPENTNPNVLEGMLDQLDNGGSNVGTAEVTFNITTFVGDIGWERNELYITVIINDVEYYKKEDTYVSSEENTILLNINDIINLYESTFTSYLSGKIGKIVITSISGNLEFDQASNKIFVGGNGVITGYFEEVK